MNANIRPIKNVLIFCFLTFLSVLSFQLPYAYGGLVESLESEMRLQEAIWISNREGDYETSKAIKKKLEFILRNDTYSEFTINRFIGKSVPSKKFLRMSSGVSAIFKPTGGPTRAGTFSYWQSEVAAYELDQLLSLDIVPLTIEFQDNEGTTGSLQVMVDVDGLGMLVGSGESSPTYSAMQIFDYLIGNFDRDSAYGIPNWFFWPDENRVVAFDNGLGFQDRVGGGFIEDTVDLYIGWKDYKRAYGSDDPFHYISDPCTLDMVLDENSQLRKGVSNRFDFSKLELRYRDTIKTISEEQVNNTLQPYVNSKATFGDNKSTMDLSLVLKRLHRIQSALKKLDL